MAMAKNYHCTLPLLAGFSLGLKGAIFFCCVVWLDTLGYYFTRHLYPPFTAMELEQLHRTMMLFYLLLPVIVLFFAYYTAFIKGEAVKAVNVMMEKKQGFLSNLSHELRTPLHVAIGLTTMLKERSNTSQVRAELLQSLQSSQNILLDVVNDFLTQICLENESLQINCSDTDLNSVLKSVTLSMQSACRAKDLQFAVFPCGKSNFFVQLDGRKLKQMLVNVVGNAIKFCEVGKVSMDCKVEYPFEQDSLDKASKFCKVTITISGEKAKASKKTYLLFFFFF